ncbi:MAG: TetR/AcrR family transcriptional regulator [Bacteroidota bacterium]
MPRTKQYTESDVLQKAMELFWKQGYHATSMQDLVQHLGINRSSIYESFDSKDGLFERAFARYRQQNREGMKTFLASQPDIKVGLRVLFEQSIDQMLADKNRKGCFVANISAELAPSDPKIAEVVRMNQEEFVEIFRSYLQRGVDSGQISADKNLDSIARMLFTLNNGLSVVARGNMAREELMASVEAALGVLE